jgi:hypothetical protein
MTLPAVIQGTLLSCSQTPNNDGLYPTQRNKNALHIWHKPMLIYFLKYV